jgi:hypothetical protein
MFNFLIQDTHIIEETNTEDRRIGIVIKKIKVKTYILERDGTFFKGKTVSWYDNGLHAAHQPNIDRL